MATIEVTVMKFYSMERYKGKDKNQICPINVYM